MRFLFFIFFWFIYFPAVRIVFVLLFWNKKLEERERFEKKNKFEYLAQTFKDKKITADLCFEFSSEGEYQQVAPLIEDALKRGLILELVFFSPSVEKAIMALAQKYPFQIRYLRYPLARLFPFIERRSFTHWVTAKTLVMVRYDLFPEFLLWGMNPKHKLKFVWFTFKKERVRGKGISFWKKLFLKNADSIIYASNLDQKLGNETGLSGENYDFRVEQIRRRVEKREEKFQDAFKVYPDLKKIFDKYPWEKRLIVGNAWPSDLFLLKNLPQDILLVVVPHDLSSENVDIFRKKLTELRGEFCEITDGTTSLTESSTILVNKKGVLCELYADFAKSYVGGGFHVSIHSVLEPLVAGKSQIAVGPLHQRSTEFDVGMDLGRMTELSTPEQFLLWLNSPVKVESDDKMNQIFQGYEAHRDEVLSC